jgi:DNA-binding XRE family transcriptional regulator
MTPGSELGRQLREARAARGATIADVAAVTKISSRALMAIEREAFDDLPAGIFRRAYVRAFATAVGLDGERLARAYVERFEPPPPVVVPAPSRWAGWTPTLLSGAVGIAGALLAAAALSSRHDASGGTETADPEPAAVIPAHAIDAREPRADAAALADPEAARVRLRLETTRPSWISAVSDGERVVHRLVGAGEVLVLDARTRIELRAGDAGAVSYSVGGRAPRVLGAPGQPLTVHFTAGGEALPPSLPSDHESV